uniref:Putative class b secretin-like g-protein coupled receptor gprmth5 n=1 Tax=Panstrongylus lignarius TaxID=156445 RepID=A0A224XG35_9HEMI
MEQLLIRHYVMLAAICWVWVLTGTAHAILEQYRSCGRRDYCQNRSIEFLYAPQNLSIDRFLRSQCYCDDECEMYDDCCIDRSLWPDQYNHHIDNIAKSLWTCRPIREDIGIYLVDGCTDDSDISSLCAREPVQDYHYALDMPVYSTLTGIYYANVYCAICHKDANHLQALKTVIQCNATDMTLQMLKEEGEYQPGLWTWRAGNRTCRLVADSLDQQGRRCVPSIDDCPNTWDNFIIRDKCHAYQQLVKNKVTVFKNPHCAICNGVDPSTLHCWQKFLYKDKGVDPSLFMIFDFNWDPNSCPLPKRVWDGLHGICREMPCNDPSCQMNEGCDNAINNTNCIEDFIRTDADILTLKIEGYLTVACFAVSIFCLTLHNIIFYTLPNQKNLPSRILSSLSWALIIAQTLFLFGISPIVTVPHSVCKGIAILIHFFFLSAFFWMNVMSIDIWHTFSKIALNTCNERSHPKYSFYAWGCSALITGFALLTDLTNFLPKVFRPYYGVLPGVCWFGNRIGLGIYLYAPLSFLLCMNALLFSITVCWFQKQAKNSEFAAASGRKEYTRLWLYVKLSTIMGLSWAFGMVAALAHRPKFWYPFILLNGLQGAFIFLMFDLKSNVLSLFFDRIGLKYFLKDAGKEGKIETRSTKISTSQNSRNSSLITKV